MSVDSESISALIENLGDLDNDVQLRAENRLIRIGEPAVDLLIEATRSSNPQTRWRAAFTLGEVGDDRAFDAVAALLDDPDGEVRADAVDAAGKLGKARAIDVLANVVRKAPDDEHAATHAAWQLAWMGSVAVPALLDIWQTGSREAKLQVAGPLGESGDPAAIEPLAARLDDPDLQFEAAYALGRLGDACGMGILLDSLRGYYDDDDHDPSCSLVALGSQAVAPLIEIAENIESPVRAQAVTLLGEIGDSAAIDALTRLRDDPALNKEALIALGKCGDERVMPELLELARNADSDWDIDVASALGRIGQAAVGSLGDLAAGGSNRTKELVASALGDIPCDESVGILDRLLNDPDADVREWAADSLWELARENLERFGQTSIQILERYLEDPYPEVRGKAAQWSADLRADLGLPENPDATKLLWRNM